MAAEAPRLQIQICGIHKQLAKKRSHFLFGNRKITVDEAIELQKTTKFQSRCSKYPYVI